MRISVDVEKMDKTEHLFKNSQKTRKNIEMLSAFKKACMKYQ